MLLTAFLEYLLLEKNYSKLTLKAYQNDIEAFTQFNQQHFQQETITQANYNQIRSWIVALVNQKISNRSINRKISALNTYYKYLLKIDEISINPLAKHKALKVSKKIQIPFSKEEITIVLDQLSSTNTFEGIRNQLIIELFYSTGMRRNELIQLKISDINLSNQTIKVLGKRNKERYIPLLPTVQKTILKYINQRKKLSTIQDTHYLLLTKKGVKIYEMLVYRIINTYFSLASQKVKKSPHILRHSFATHLLNEGANLNAVKELLGHSSLAATQVYTHNNIEQLKKVYQNAHPRSTKNK